MFRIALLLALLVGAGSSVQVIWERTGRSLSAVAGSPALRLPALLV